MAAVNSGKRLLLANKEALVMAGALYAGGPALWRSGFTGRL